MGKKSKKTGALGNTGQGQLADAFKALRTAQGTIEALQKAQQAAAEEVRLASTAVHQAKQSEHQGRSTETYGEERYWENRYKSDATGCHSSQEVLYEWYLPYSDLRLLLKPELDRFGGSSARLLIPGCGNSSLCEDLALDGKISSLCFDA